MALGAEDDEPVVDLPNKWTPHILHTLYDTIEVWSLSWLNHGSLHTRKLAQVHNSESNVVYCVAVPSACPPVVEGVPLHVISLVLRLCNWLLKTRLMHEEHSEELRRGRWDLSVGLVLGLELLCLRKVLLPGVLEEDVHWRTGDAGRGLELLPFLVDQLPLCVDQPQGRVDVVQLLLDKLLPLPPFHPVFRAIAAL